MKQGIIILWYGIAANIPYGWKFCNGFYGTPYLANCFVVGAGSAYAVGDVGGSVSHNHHFTCDSHRHPCIALPGVTTNALPFRITAQATEYEPAIGDTDPESSLPKYHALYFIMRM